MHDLVTYLQEKSRVEKIDVDEPVFTEIARQATGSFRDAVSLLDQLTSSTEHITLDLAQKVLGTATNLRVIEVIDALLAKDAQTGLALINAALDSGVDARQFSRQVVTYLRNVLLFKMDNKTQVEAGEMLKATLDKHAAQLSMPELLKAITAFNEATTQERFTWHPGLALELAFTNYLVEPETTPLADQKTDEHIRVPLSAPVPSVAKSEVRKEKAKPASPPVQAVTTTDAEKPVEKDKVEAVEQATPKSQEPPEQEDAETAPESKFAPAQPKGDISFGDIQKAWMRIKTLVKQHNPRTEGLLNTSKLAGIKGNVLILAFSSNILKEMMEKEGNLTLTMDILEEVLGQPILIECIVSTHEENVIPDDLEIDQDGMVSTATRDLGGRISRAKEEK